MAPVVESRRQPWSHDSIRGIMAFQPPRSCGLRTPSP